jgi:hypothetical protein
MGFVKRKGTKAARKVPDNMDEVKAEFHERIRNVVREFNIPGTAFNYYYVNF